ncbi:hypothetical protein [Undibacterium squillarum]|uniref:hypothetical protein n=1 Tax=Undibacterium squillarum TaxID=1131567 RepID=UPI0035B1EABF
MAADLAAGFFGAALCFQRFVCIPVIVKKRLKRSLKKLICSLAGYAFIVIS